MPIGNFMDQIEQNIYEFFIVLLSSDLKPFSILGFIDRNNNGGEDFGWGGGEERGLVKGLIFGEEF